MPCFDLLWWFFMGTVLTFQQRVQMCPSLQVSDPAQKAEWTPQWSEKDMEGMPWALLGTCLIICSPDRIFDRTNWIKQRGGKGSLELLPENFSIFLLHKDFINTKRGKKQIKRLCGYKAHAAIDLLHQCHFPLFLKVTKTGTLNGLVEDIFMSSPVNRFILKERKICEQLKRTSWALGWISEWWINPREVEQNRDKIWQKLGKAEWCAGMKWVQILPSLEIKMLEPNFDLMWVKEMP